MPRPLPLQWGGAGDFLPTAVTRREPSLLKATTLSPEELSELDRFYREGGLLCLASPHVHYDDPNCPHPGCGQRMEWIDFKLELHGDPEGVYKPLAQSWWGGTGFVGRCPGCQRWIRFTTMKMGAVDESQAGGLPQLPADWPTMAQFA